MNDSRLSTWTFHLNGLMGGQGRVSQRNGVEAGSVLHTERSGVSMSEVGFGFIVERGRSKVTEERGI